ncbi:nickel-binding protein [Candidatus Neomarinimicrobiota bacterium]
MPFYMDLHEVPSVSEEDMVKAHLADIAVQDQFGATCHTYWFNKEAGTANCLVEAPSEEQANAIHKASHGMVGTKVIEVNESVVEAFLGQIKQTAVAKDHATAHPDSAIRIILFTDIVGSTQMTQKLGDEGAMHVLQVHDIVVRDALDKYNGSEVKHTGDGIMASFSSVAGSINCAIATQRGIGDYNQTGPNHDLHVRIGLCAGEPVEKNQDLFGTSVQLAARICEHAGADEILVARTVQQLSAGKGFTFAPADDVLMKGFSTPTQLDFVVWDQ